MVDFNPVGIVEWIWPIETHLLHISINPLTVFINTQNPSPEFNASSYQNIFVLSAIREQFKNNYLDAWLNLLTNTQRPFNM